LTAHDLSKLVSIVPQNPQLPAGFTVNEIVLLARNPYLKLFQWERFDDLKVAEIAMVTTETIELADRQFSTLSGGERQRVLIAMALTQDTKVMLLDEPISNLDLSHQIRIMDLIVNLVRSQGRIGLIAMHDLSLAAQYCDRIVMIADGKIFADGIPSQVLTPTNISAVYGADVIVVSHPVTGMPVVLPLSGMNSGG
jgi:iron complex transport system ATP-binding protein